MSLNRSPEFTISNPNPSAAELFGSLRPPFDQTQKSSTMQSSIPHFKHLSQLVLKHKIFFIFSYVFLCFKLRSPWRKAILDSWIFIWTSLIKDGWLVVLVVLGLTAL